MGLREAKEVMERVPPEQIKFTDPVKANKCFQELQGLGNTCRLEIS